MDHHYLRRNGILTTTPSWPNYSSMKKHRYSHRTESGRIVTGQITHPCWRLRWMRRQPQ